MGKDFSWLWHRISFIRKLDDACHLDDNALAKGSVRFVDIMRALCGAHSGVAVAKCVTRFQHGMRGHLTSTAQTSVSRLCGAVG